jgi:DNA 3'-phosphatase
MLSISASGNTFKYNPSKAAAFFDIDHTVIFPAKGKRFYSPKDNYAWVLRPFAKERLHEIARTHNIFFITNQVKFDDIIKARIQGLLDILELEAIAFVSFTRDFHRKPGIGVVDFLPKKCIENYSPKDFHCGDAAGRVSDFSDDDFWFAQHMKIRFFTPEELFDDKIDITKEYPLKLVPSPSIDIALIKILGKILREHEGVMLIGLPGSGKSYIRDWLVGKSTNPIVFNKDEKRSDLEGISSGAVGDHRPFYILDNVNLKSSQRRSYPRDILSKDIVKIYIDLDPKDAIRGIKYRVAFGGEYIPDVIVYTMNKTKEIPSDIFLHLTKRPVVDHDFPPYLSF